MYTVLLQVEGLTKEQRIMVRTSLPVKEYVPLTRLCPGSHFDSMACSFAAEKHLSTSPLSLKMQVLLGPVKYVYPPNDPTSIPTAVPMAYRKGMGDFPLRLGI